ncbi:hypothetical protein F4801DRAFT_579984 [Xylaria longipes]|nr:hypothetical protein F4801DRAFT_579984 [Xylaria longipes]RYC62427.1 hypothetical protein CHU98_g3772 [Xylaria longipes]
MENQQVFHPFSRLPAELRHEIWLFSLNSLSLIEVLYTDDTIRLLPFERSQAVVGQACREARCLMTKTFKRLSKPLFRHGCLYVNFETNIFHFGPASSAQEHVALLGEPAFSSLISAALIWTCWNDVARCFKMLSHYYPCLATVFIFAADLPVNVQPRHLATADLDLMTASLYGYEREFEARTLDSEWICTQLKAWFRSPLNPPRVVLLPL